MLNLLQAWESTCFLTPFTQDSRFVLKWSQTLEKVFTDFLLEVFHFLTVMLHICIQGEKLKSGTDLATEKFMWTLLDQLINH